MNRSIIMGKGRGPVERGRGERNTEVWRELDKITNWLKEN
jgi:hypothetical protein